MLGWLVLLFSCVLTAEIFKSSKDVITLTSSNFNQVVDDKGLWLVIFYADWCGHCKSFGPEFAKGAESLSGLIKFGAVDAQSESQLSSKYGIEGFPTVKIFGKDKSKPVDYDGDRTHDSIIKTLTKYIEKSAGVKKEKKEKKEKTTKTAPTKETDGNVIILNDDNFDEKLKASDKPWLIKFFAPWCGHCKNMAQAYKDAAEKMKGKFNYGEVDCTVEKTLCSKYQVKGFPTLKSFKVNNDKFDVSDYQGGRDVSDLVQFAESQVGTTPPKPMEQLLSQSDFTNCFESTLCIVAFLPPMADTTSKERSKHIKLVDKVKSKISSDKFTWLWTEGLVNHKVETSLNIVASNFPLLVVFRKDKNVYYVNPFAFTEANNVKFINQIKSGKANFLDIPSKLPAFDNAVAWKSNSDEL